MVVPLKFTDWLRLIPASLTAEYWKGELSPEVALPSYHPYMTLPSYHP